jgi:hypothetical protein
MPLTPSDATAALRDIKQMEHRSALLRGYQSASPHLMIWGVVWAVGYMLNYLLPAWINFTWLPLIVLGVIGDILAARADGRNGLSAATIAWLWAAYVMLIVGTIAVMQPHDVRQVAAFNALVIGAAYIIYGTFGAPRMTVIGAGIAVLTVGGYFALDTLFLPWMAAVGGGGLVLSGFWLRQA